MYCSGYFKCLISLKKKKVKNVLVGKGGLVLREKVELRVGSWVDLKLSPHLS